MSESVKRGRKKIFYSGTGRRKRAVAGVWLYPKAGEILVNDIPIDEYFSDVSNAFLVWVKPFHVIGISHPRSKFSATLKVRGGGKSSQVEAVRLGFARALVAYSEEFRKKLKAEGLLTRDPREKESKKYYHRKARRAPQFSKR